MKRDLHKALKIWAGDKRPKPIVLRGARQVGKTTVVRQLALDFDDFTEINFEEYPDVCKFFEDSLNPQELLHYIQNYFGMSVEVGKTLLFFDEVQVCPKALMSLRYFYEKLPGLHVIAAGSLIDFALSDISFPVGRVDFYYLYPLSFSEYLVASGDEKLCREIEASTPQPAPLHKKILRKFREYCVIGGMPEVVDAYLDHGDMSKCQQIQSSILETFEADFPKYAKRHQLKYLSTVFSAIPSQLGRKFKYTNISSLYRGRDLGDALDLLERAGLVRRVHHSSSNGIPLEHEKNPKKFKVILFDIGLVMRMLRIPIKEILVNQDVDLINEGALAEQFVGQEILAYSDIHVQAKLYYWHREAKSSNAEVDYVIEHEGEVIPVEVKSGLKKHLTSLRMFREEKSPPFALCYSQGEMSEMDGIRFRPFYQLMALRSGEINL